MDKAIKKGFQKVEKTAMKQENKLVKMDKKRDKACEKSMEMSKKKR